VPPVAPSPSSRSSASQPSRVCRACGSRLEVVFADLGNAPLSNSYLSELELDTVEHFYPLRVFVCGECFLVQLEEFESAKAIFSDYAYFSSYSSSWLDHSRRYAERMIGELGLGADSQVVEVASNDGYLLQYFAAQGVPILGIEPAVNVAKTAVERGIPTIVEFFGAASATRLADQRQAELIVANNVMAHVPDINDFIEGFRILLAPQGRVTGEFPHLARLIAEEQFDTIYHEHFSYFSLMTLRRIFNSHGLEIFDVERLATHGGSLRIHAGHASEHASVSPAVEEVLHEERELDLDTLAPYQAFGEVCVAGKLDLLTFLIEAKRSGRSVAGYGAPAKANTLLNYCGVGPELLPYTVDLNPHKQDRYLPGTHIPISAPDRIREERPDYVMLLPWNIAGEIMEQLAFVRDWGGRFVMPRPRVEVIE
jgi:SAM-dependent methyltransferase